MKCPNDFINKIICGDCLETMKEMPDNCIDTIITDPPYGLEFMGKEWDRLSGKGRYQKGGVWQEVEGYSPPAYKGGNEAQKFHYQWAIEALRVAKPGSTLLCFGGTRTYHRLACAIEDAGWILKDCIMWLYASGFPKATDISKQIDKNPNVVLANQMRDKLNEYRIKKGLSIKQVNEHFGFATTGSGVAHHWMTHPTQPTIPTEEQYQRLKKLLEIDNKDLDKLYIEAEREITGKGKNWGKKGSVPISGYKEFELKNQPTTEQATLWSGWKSHGLKPAYEPILVCMKPNEGSYANNALKWGVAGINVDGGRIGATKDDCKKTNRLNVKDKKYNTGIFNSGVGSDITKGRFPANVILDEESAGLLDEQAPKTGAFAKVKFGHSGKSKGIYNDYAQRGDDGETFYDDGLQGASRFFYCAKASKSERNRGCEWLENVKFTAGNYSQSPICKDCGKTLNGVNDHSNCSGEIEYREMRSKKIGNNHPTVKPLSLMKYLCTLTKTPTGGIVLDPFCGSGTTLMACKELKRDYIGIDNNPEYCEIARKRIKAIPELLF